MSKYAIANPCGETSFKPMLKTGLVRVSCKVCGALIMGDSIEEVESKKCQTCGHPYGTEINTCIDNTEANSETHARFNWYCSKCKHKGLLWKEKGKGISECPNCGAENIYMRIRTIDPTKGRCQNLWDTMSQPISKNISIDQFKPEPLFVESLIILCPVCNAKHFIRYGKVPTRCDRCEALLPKEKGIGHANH